MADRSSNPSSCDASARTQQELEYSHALKANVSNFVSVKLSGYSNYRLWERQMSCLLKSYNVDGLIYGADIHPGALSPDLKNRFDSLVKGWIFGSISEGLLDTVADMKSAKDIWDTLKSICHPTMSDQKGSSNPCIDALAQTKQEMEYSHALNAHVSNFVSVKLSGVRNYHIWENQMVCLLKSYNVQGVIYRVGDIHPDEALGPHLQNRFDTLVKGWIFGSISEGLLDSVVDQKSAKDVWDNLKRVYDPTITSFHKDKDADPTEDTDLVLPFTIEDFHKNIHRKGLSKAIAEGQWDDVLSRIIEDKDAITKNINSDGNTVLHIAVGIGRNNLVDIMLSLIEKDILSEKVNVDGSTALHIAAIVGNTKAAKILVGKNRKLLDILDHKGETPLDKAYENMHLDTIEYLLNACTKNKSSPSEDFLSRGQKSSNNILVNAVSGKNYDLATKLIKMFPKFAVENDKVLMAIASNFPSGLDFWETSIYPSSMNDVCERMTKRARFVFYALVYYRRLLNDFRWDGRYLIPRVIGLLLITVPCVVLWWIFLIALTQLLLCILDFPLSMFYIFLWKVSSTVGLGPSKHIEEKKKEWEDAKRVLKLVCDEIVRLPDKSNPGLYREPLLEAARQDAYEVVNEILMRSPRAIQYKDKSGYDIIQLAVIHRSEKIYNLIHIIWEGKSIYRKLEDSSKNNMLHLAGRLAPSHKLKLRNGAAFQLQRELQWRKEVKKLVSPTYITKKNIYMETPDMIFTKEHENLLKEGENWMKTVAESCSITASLITTIVFAAAITVPGGSDQSSGTPLLRKEIAFTIFGVADAVSLFASTTALLTFQSILTGRFSEQEFLVRLPRRLIIGLYTLMISITAMMVAFSATLFLVFCHRKQWMLAPICVLSLVPVLYFGNLQIPLMVDLFRSTDARIFGKQIIQHSHRFNPDVVRLFSV